MQSVSELKLVLDVDWDVSWDEDGLGGEEVDSESEMGKNDVSCLSCSYPGGICISSFKSVSLISIAGAGSVLTIVKAYNVWSKATWRTSFV